METIYQNKLLYPEILWERPVHYYKSQAGKILAIAGSRSEQAIALLTCEAIFRCGTGILTLAFPEELKPTYAGILPEAMTLALPQTHSGSISREAKEQVLSQLGSVDVVLIGPGLSTNTETVQFIWEILPLIKKPLIIDDDGLRALAYGIDAIRGKEGIEKVREYFNALKSKIIVTPHSGEIGQILNALGIENGRCKSTYIDKHKEESVITLFENIKATVVLKGSSPIIYNGQKMVIDKVNQAETGPAATNEVLAGIIASFVAQNPKKTFKAVATAVYLHSLAKRLAKDNAGSETVSTNDIIRYLPKSIKESENN